MMGKTPSFSKSQLARAHVRLRRWLGEEVRVTHLSMETLLSLRSPGRRAGGRGGPGAPGRVPRGAGPSWIGCISGWPGSRPLPPLRPARDRWPQVAARLRAGRRAPSEPASAGGLAGLAAAASIALAVGIAPLLRTDDRGRQRPDRGDDGPVSGPRERARPLRSREPGARRPHRRDRPGAGRPDRPGGPGAGDGRAAGAAGAASPSCSGSGGSG